MKDFKGLKVLVTGHTGFKGAWLTLWLNLSGAEVIGVSLDPEFEKGAFTAMNIFRHCHDNRQDINDINELKRVFEIHKPHIVFHLAAQPLVLESYKYPIDTLRTNVLGTANVLEACRNTSSVKAIVVVTSDKCYENRGDSIKFNETDILGGKDPYSASKAAAEIIVNAYRASFLQPSRGIGLATVRAGNVIGGGDWAANRIVPDCINSLLAGIPIEVRNPESTRPWQYILEPLRGYLNLSISLLREPYNFSEPWNFGPGDVCKKEVGELVEEIITAWGSGSWIRKEFTEPMQKDREAKYLSLDITKASKRLGWSPLLSFTDSIKNTIDWYKAQASGENMEMFGINAITEYERFF